MTPEEKVKLNIGYAFDFLDEIISNPDKLDEIESGTTIRFYQPEEEIHDAKKEGKIIPVGRFMEPA